ncbi:MAG: type VI secretion system ImpA family N-terminal domain-containing protein [Alphaproteobacteria bacterium]|nr:MAG: type VI secretion system ImpA family N-terminal domain-containing protein [Alphaproteobacteria bacterium]
MYQMSDAYKVIDNPIDDINYTNAFLQLETIMNSPNDTLPKGIWSTSKVQDYQSAEQDCLEILSTQKKDIQIAVWLVQIEFWLKKDIVQAIKILDYVFENYYDSNELAFIKKSFINLNKFLNITLPKSIIVSGNQKDGYTFLAEQNRVTSIDANVKSDQDLWINLLHTLLLKVQAKIGENLSCIAILEKYKLLHSVNEKSDYDDMVENSNIQSSQLVNIKSRHEAYLIINEVMKYLQKYDQHSATPYLLKKACEWENKSFVDILNEFNDPIIMKKIFS